MRAFFREHGTAFLPEEVDVLQGAFDLAWERLSKSRGKRGADGAELRRALAQQIVLHREHGESDMRRLATIAALWIEAEEAVEPPARGTDEQGRSRIARSPHRLRNDWIVAIGASGSEGLQDLTVLLGLLGSRLNAVVMIVLHRSFGQPTALREILQRAAEMPVIVAEGDEKLVRGRCYIGEAGAHLTLLARSYGDITPDPGDKHRNRTVDLLFASVAEHAGPYGIGVVLSGSLDDGSRGLKAIHDAGGTSMALLRRSAQKGMPENAIAYDGRVDFIGSTEAIAGAIRHAVFA